MNPIKMNLILTRQTLSSVLSFASLGLVLAIITGFLSACATSRTSDDSLAQLCAQEDLSKTSQRVVLAGGYHALNKHDLACAERLSADARKKDMNDPYAALNLGAVYQRTGRIEQARELYSTVVSLDEKNEKSSAEQSHLATRDKQVHKSPAEIARHNLALLQQR